MLRYGLKVFVSLPTSDERGEPVRGKEILKESGTNP